MSSRNRERKLLKKYGLDLKDYDELAQLQGYRCAICGTHQDILSKNLAVDHNHRTNQLRGLLCIRCNIGLGCFNDSKHMLREAVKYLEKHENSEKLPP